MTLPGGAMVSMTVYDFDTGPNDDYEEILTVPEYAYYKTPLRPESGNVVNSTIAVDTATKTFTSTAAGDSSGNPTDPMSLTDEQASRGVTFFFKSDDGEVEATFKVTSTTAGCTGRNLLFAGDAAMCTPPPPMPPQPPPSPPPPSPPPLAPPRKVSTTAIGTSGAGCSSLLTGSGGTSVYSDCGDGDGDGDDSDWDEDAGKGRPPLPAPASEDDVSGVLLADLNGDGLDDMIVLTREDVPSYVYLNPGDGDFSSVTPSAIGTGATAPATDEGLSTDAAVADVNGDGLVDMVVANHGTSNMIYLGQPAPSRGDFSASSACRLAPRMARRSTWRWATSTATARPTSRRPTTARPTSSTGERL